MTISKHFAPYTANGRYFTTGDPSSHDYWILLHGYAQLADELLESFTNLSGAYFISIEGLHRFYKKGFNGKVGASWMTKEDRLVDIDNYLNWINSVVEDVVPKTKNLNVLGFSQGVATACRWADHTSRKINSLVSWCGMFPPDVEVSDKNQLNCNRFYNVYDPKDPFRTNHHDEQIMRLENSGTQIINHQIDSGHKVLKEDLSKFFSEFKRSASD